MIAPLLRVTAALAISLTAADGWAQESSSQFRRPTLIACDPPEWTDEARRYELEGTTVLQYNVDDGGRPSSVRLARSSGWNILDQMAVRAISSCRFEPSSDPQVVRAGLRVPYNWRLEENDEKPVPAALVAGSCAPSKHLAQFLAFNGKVTHRDDGILVRFLLDEEGNTFGIKVEETHPAPVNVATAFIQSCRFTPATLNGKPVRGNLQGWLSFK